MCNEKGEWRYGGWTEETRSQLDAVIPRAVCRLAWPSLAWAKKLKRYANVCRRVCLLFVIKLFLVNYDRGFCIVCARMEARWRLLGARIRRLHFVFRIDTALVVYRKDVNRKFMLALRHKETVALLVAHQQMIRGLGVVCVSALQYFGLARWPRAGILAYEIPSMLQRWFNQSLLH